MSEVRIEGESPQTIHLPEEETKKVAINGAFSNDEINSANAIIQGEQEKGHRIEDAALVKTQVKGIRSRNPIIVVMLIMQIVSNTLKASSDHTKEITKLTKREWKAFTLKQSENFMKGRDAIKGGEDDSLLSPNKLGVLGLAASQAHHIPFLPENWKPTLRALGPQASTMVNTYVQQSQQATGLGVQGKEAPLQQIVASLATDHQRWSQDNGEQLKSGADDKLPQILSTVTRMMTERA